jgi:hypothetical protein
VGRFDCASPQPFGSVLGSYLQRVGAVGPLTFEDRDVPHSEVADANCCCNDGNDLLPKPFGLGLLPLPDRIKFVEVADDLASPGLRQSLPATLLDLVLISSRKANEWSGQWVRPEPWGVAVWLLGNFGDGLVQHSAILPEV